MKIVYVAKHGNGGNDEEGAIKHALEELGHNVQLFHETEGNLISRQRGDLCLFHKWYDTRWLRNLPFPKIFWYFDLVNYPDPLLEHRNKSRIQWMQAVTPLVDLGFCTDGDWVLQDPHGKLIWLPQAFDGRYIGKTKLKDERSQILFMGIKNGGGDARKKWVSLMSARYGSRFCHVERGVHGEQLKNMIGTAQIVVAPDSPVTDNYWSNRVYLTLGNGGFLLHPFAKNLVKHYAGNVDLVYYNNMEQLDNLISNYLQSRLLRDHISDAGLERTRKQHLYLHRCEEMLGVVKERLGVY